MPELYLEAPEPVVLVALLPPGVSAVAPRESSARIYEFEFLGSDWAFPKEDVDLAADVLRFALALPAPGPLP